MAVDERELNHNFHCRVNLTIRSCNVDQMLCSFQILSEINERPMFVSLDIQSLYLLVSRILIRYLQNIIMKLRSLNIRYPYLDNRGANH